MHRVLVLCFLCFGLFVSAANLPPGFVEIPLAMGLDPTGMAQAPDGRIFLLEKYGAVRIVENDVLLPDPFIQLDVDNFNERGLSGIAFDPDFATNGYVYLYYTVKSAGHNRLIRVQAVGNYALPGSAETLLELDPLAGTVHNAGAMAFGADGKLYLAVGESSDGKRAPDLHSLLGKVLRLNPDGTIPTDNPFYDQTTGVFRAIYAVGFRNPFSLAIQPGTNRVFVGDVGNDQFEEINDVQAGMHYGWNILEGKRSTQQLPANYRDPLYAYPHSIGCAVVGATFYNPPVAVFPAGYVGKFFFADYCKNFIKILNPETGDIEGTFATDIDRPLVLLTGRNGELYYISRGGMGGGSDADNTSSGEGILWKVTYVGDGAPVFSTHPHHTLIPVGEDAVFSANANGSQPIQYQWQRDGVAIPGATGKTLTLPAVTLADSGAVIRCLAVNGFGPVYSQEAVLRVTTDQRPLPQIDSPTGNYNYAAGDTVWFSGHATDPETGALDADALSWRLDLHHDQHTHPGTATLSGISSGYYVVPRIGETSVNVWLRIYLSARDPLGLTRTVYRDIYPQKTKLEIESDPPGISVRVDAKTYTTPFEVESVKGLFHQVQAQPAFPGTDTIRVFARWENGTESPDTAVYADAAVTSLRAVYDDVALHGTGVLGMYHLLTPDTTFDRLVFSRIDTMINFSWGDFAPDPQLPADLYAVRWLGFVAPLISETYYFHIDSDDGFRFWVDDQLVAESWRIKGPGEVTGGIYLEKGKKHAIRLDYFEYGLGASAKLSWSSVSVPKEIIPKKRLFPRLPDNPGNEDGRFNFSLQPNPVHHLLTVVFDAEFRESFELRLIDGAGRLVRQYGNQVVDAPLQRLHWPVAELPTGMYWIELEREGKAPVVRSFVKL